MPENAFPLTAPATETGAPGVRRAPQIEIVQSPRMAMLRDALDSAPGPQARVGILDEFWSQTAEVGTPLIELVGDAATGERIVTFVYRGRESTKNVLLLANRVTDRRRLADTALKRLSDTDVWHLSLRMRSDWQSTYQLAADGAGTTAPLGAAVGSTAVGGTAAGPNRAGAGDLEPQPLDALLAHAAPDPLARQQFRSIWFGPAMSAAVLPDADVDAAWISHPPPEAQRGTVTEHVVDDGSNSTRRVWVYQPSSPLSTESGNPLALLVLLDGRMWAEVADISAALDVLIASGELPPTLVVMPESLAGPERATEFACNPEFVERLRKYLLPWVAANWPISTDPSRRVIAGTSMGGLAAVWAATQAPDEFGAALAQSGSFWWGPAARPGIADGPPGQWLTEHLLTIPTTGVRIALAVGSRESLLLEPTHRLHHVVKGRGYTCTLLEFNGGHDLFWWRTALTRSLRWALADDRRHE